MGGFVPDHASGCIDPPNRALRVNVVAADAGGPDPVILVPAALSFSHGGTILNPDSPINIVVWRAPFTCTLTAVKGFAVGASGTTVNARKNGSLTHLASDLTLSSTGSWLDGGAVQNTSYVAGDELEIMLTGIGGVPTQIAVQVDFARA